MSIRYSVKQDALAFFSYDKNVKVSVKENKESGIFSKFQIVFI